MSGGLLFYLSRCAEIKLFMLCYTFIFTHGLNYSSNK
ncbi:Hypothetical protein SmN45_2659 [Serratia marcescens]|nr:Hypothetical protein SmN45_2659 [Serratia marcescens]